MLPLKETEYTGTPCVSVYVCVYFATCEYIFQNKTLKQNGTDGYTQNRHY